MIEFSYLMKAFLKKILPKQLISVYHLALAHLAALIYGRPSEKMLVIGLTGTKGKTTAANFIWSVLQAAGHKTGLLGTANVRIGEKEMLNEWHMTMPGRFKLQKLLRQMVNEGCTHVVMEVTSEGIIQHRHKGIDFDIAIFTNLYPEHLPSHGGSFENYKKAKGKLFECLNYCPRKIVGGEKIDKTIIANFDDEHKDYYLSFPADKKITYGLKEGANIHAANIASDNTGVNFSIRDTRYTIHVLGEFNVYNALPAIAVGSLLGATNEQIQSGLKSLPVIPGRMEIIENNKGFTVIVDYAHQKESMYAALEAVQKMKPSPESKIIVNLGAEGGGRDPRKRPLMGEAVAKLADYVICSNVDPYEDDPYPIANDIAVAAEAHGKVRDQNLWVILDRREGIKKCLLLAKPGDIVLITGKGAEQSITIGGKVSPWDDRVVVREELNKLN